MSAQSTPATLIDGKAFSATLVDRVAAAVQRLETDHGFKPGLARHRKPMIRVGLRRSSERHLLGAARSGNPLRGGPVLECHILLLA